MPYDRADNHPAFRKITVCLDPYLANILLWPDELGDK